MLCSECETECGPHSEEKVIRVLLSMPRCSSTSTTAPTESSR